MARFGKSTRLNVTMNFALLLSLVSYPREFNSTLGQTPRERIEGNEPDIRMYVDRRSSRSYEIGTFHSLASPWWVIQSRWASRASKFDGCREKPNATLTWRSTHALFFVPRWNEIVNLHVFFSSFSTFFLSQYSCIVGWREKKKDRKRRKSMGNDGQRAKMRGKKNFVLFLHIIIYRYD